MSTLTINTLWLQADFITRVIALVLLLMSVLSWTVMLTKAVQLSRLARLTRQGRAAFWQAPDWAHALDSLGSIQHNPFVALAQAGHAAHSHVGQQQAKLHDRFDPSDWLGRCLKDALDDHIAWLQSGQAVLASVGSTAPFVGLFGTVWGIYHALHAIGQTGQASIGQVAGPVGEALVMTGFGLFVAIPAVLGYNAIARRNKTVVHELARFASDLHAYFLTGARIALQPALASVR